MKLTTGQDPEQEQQDDSGPDIQPGSNQGTPEPENGLQQKDPIEFRIQHLQNRRFLLLKMQHFTQRAEDNSDRITVEMAGEDSDEVCELEAIQKELEELLRKKELEKQEKSSTFSQQYEHPTFHKPARPCGGIYLLPPHHLTQEDVALEQRAKTRPADEIPTSPVVPVDSLGETAAVTQCPSCHEAVLTETNSRVGKTAWKLCLFCSMLGCVTGCCLVPFFMDRLRDVHHQCPQCHAHVHTYQPF